MTRSHDVLPEKTDRVHWHRLAKRLVSTCHIDTGAFAHLVCVGQQRQHSALPVRNINSLGTVSGSIDIRLRRLGILIDNNALIDPGNPIQQLRIGPHADSQDKTIKQNSLLIIQDNRISAEPGDSAGKSEPDPLLFQMFLNPFGSMPIQNAGKDFIRQVNNRDGRDLSRRCLLRISGRSVLHR